MTDGVLFCPEIWRRAIGEVRICFFARAIVIRGLSSVNLMRVASCPLIMALSKILQGRIGDKKRAGASLYLGICSRVKLKSISIKDISLSSDSIIAVS